MALTASEWLDRFATELGGVERDDDATVLELAAIAAHASERVAAPLSCWLAARAGVSADEARATAQLVADRLAALPRASGPPSEHTTMADWIAHYAGALSTAPPDEAERRELLALAAAAAAGSERIAAPISCWICGKSGRTPEASRRVAERLEADSERGTERGRVDRRTGTA